jgi:glyoxylase-like metal-dependent hydrolase (beta-lactamase superfamily II)/rhodanese-related sulfurtransferase
MIDLVVIPTQELGDRSYIVHDGRYAVVIDPQRDIDRTLGYIKELNLEVTAVGETHMHNDYVTGGFGLAQELGVDYLVFEGEQVSYKRRSVADKDILRYGSFEIQILHTPGHTPNHISFVARAVNSDQTPIVMSGGSLLYGSVGRTDLISPDMTEELTRLQYRSAHRLVEELPGATLLMPTHGFGSFCSSIAVANDEQVEHTLDREKQVNVVFKYDNEDEFVKMLVASFDPYPAYYKHMGPANVSGPNAIKVDEVPVITAERAKELAESGAVLVDIRPRKDYLEAHAPGTLGFEYSSVFSTYYGWIHKFGTPIVLVTDSKETAKEAIISLGRIGIDDVKGVVDADELMALVGKTSTPRVSYEEYVAKYLNEDHQLLDVRNPSEQRASSFAKAVQVPLYFLEENFDKIDTSKPVVVHCAGGYRAAAAGSMLENKGCQVVVIDDSFDKGMALMNA